jgi:hypothetical protein
VGCAGFEGKLFWLRSQMGSVSLPFSSPQAKTQTHVFAYFPQFAKNFVSLLDSICIFQFPSKTNFRNILLYIFYLKQKQNFFCYKEIKIDFLSFFQTGFLSFFTNFVLRRLFHFIFTSFHFIFFGLVSLQTFLFLFVAKQAKKPLYSLLNETILIFFYFASEPKKAVDPFRKVIYILRKVSASYEKGAQC